MEFLTVKETADLLRVSPITVRRYIASGRLAAERVGRGIRVRREAIEEFVTPVVPGANSHDQFYIGRANANGSTDAMNVQGEPLHRVMVESGTEARGGAEDEGAERLPAVLDALGVSAGIFRTGQPTNIAEHKDEYLAEAFEHKG